MHNLLEMTNRGQHGEDCFNDHVLILLIPFADLEIGWITLSGKEAMVGKGHGLIFNAGNQGMKMSVIDICCGTIPASDQYEVVKYVTRGLILFHMRAFMVNFVP
jgi:hypothetical protein